MAVRVVESCVVSNRRDTAPVQRLGDSLNGSSRRRIDDSETWAAAQDLDESFVLVAIGPRRYDVVPEVAAVEPGDDRALILEAELAGDVGSHVRRRRRRERHHRWPPETLAHLRDPQVTRTEIVAPLAYAVCLVDGEKRNVELAQSIREVADVEALGGDV
jgi:hypothetical protein